MQQNPLRRHVRVSAQLQPAKLLGSASPYLPAGGQRRVPLRYFLCLSGRVGFRRLWSELPPAGDPGEVPTGRGGTIRHPDRDHPGHPGSDLDPVHLLRHGPRNPLGSTGPAERGIVQRGEPPNLTFGNGKDRIRISPIRTEPGEIWNAALDQQTRLTQRWTCCIGYAGQQVACPSNQKLHHSFAE